MYDEGDSNPIGFSTMKRSMLVLQKSGLFVRFFCILHNNSLAI